MAVAPTRLQRIDHDLREATRRRDKADAQGEHGMALLYEQDIDRLLDERKQATDALVP